MANDGKRTGLWGKLARGLFEFDAPLTANLLPLLPDAATRRRGGRAPVAGGHGRGVEEETLDIDLRDAFTDPERERAALVVVHGQAPGERFDLEVGTITLGPDDDAVLTCGDDGVSLRAGGPTADIHVEFRRVSEARLVHGALVGIGGTLLKFLRCRDLEAAHFDEIYRLHRFDGLMEVHHERHLRHRLRGALSHARRHGSGLAVVVLDVAPRTVRGVAVTGAALDLVLREVARAAVRGVREEEILGRHGADQLVLVLPGMDEEGAGVRAEALRAAVEAAAIVVEGQRVATVPSVGVAVYERGMLVHDDLLAAALAALPAGA